MSLVSKTTFCFHCGSTKYNRNDSMVDKKSCTGIILYNCESCHAFCEIWIGPPHIAGKVDRYIPAKDGYSFTRLKYTNE